MFHGLGSYIGVLTSITDANSDDAEKPLNTLFQSKAVSLKKLNIW